MRISFCEAWWDDAWKTVSSFFSGAFQSSFMRISFCEYAVVLQVKVDSDATHFQSSFMRISFCEEETLNRVVNSLIFFQSSFMRISFCERFLTSYRYRGAHNFFLSILFYEDFFLRERQTMFKQQTNTSRGNLSILFYEDFFLRVR